MRKLIILFTAPAVFSGCQSVTTKQGGDDKKINAPTNLTADEIRKEFHKSKDEVYAKYNGKEITVKGNVRGRSDIFGDTHFELGTWFETGDLQKVGYVTCISDKENSKGLAGVKGGEDITVKGYFFVEDNGNSMMLRGCRKDSPEPAPKPIPEIVESETIRQEYAKSKDDVFAKYNGREITVKGKVHSIDPPVGEADTYVNLAESFAGEMQKVPYIYCMVGPKQIKSFESVKAKDEITVKGFFFMPARGNGADALHQLELVGCHMAGK